MRLMHWISYFSSQILTHSILGRTYNSIGVIPRQSVTYNPQEPRSLQLILNMNIQIRLPQSGVKYSISLPLGARVKQLQEFIRNEYKIQISDQLIISKTGSVLHPEHQFDSHLLEKEKTYVNQNQNLLQLKRIYCVHVFSRKTLRSQETVKSPRDEELYEQLKKRCKQTASLNPKSEFKPLEQSRSKEQLSKLQQLNPNALTQVSYILNRDERLLNQLNQYEQLRTIVEEQSDQAATQSKSCSALFKSLWRIGEEITYKGKNLSSNVDAFRSTRDESFRHLDQLRKMPLPQKLQQQFQYRTKSVFDLFLTDQKIKDFTVESQSNLQQVQSKLKEYGQILETYCMAKTGRIADIKANIYPKFKSRDLDTISNNLEQFNNEVNQIKLSRETCYRNIFDNVNRWLRNHDDQESREYLLNLNFLIQKIDKSNESYLGILTEQNDQLRKSYVYLYKHKTRNQSNFKQAYQRYQVIEGELLRIDREFKKIDKDINILSKEVETSWNSKEFKEVYQMSKGQIQKRLQFCGRLYNFYRQGMKLTEEEEERRKKFISNRKKSKVPEFCPQLMSYASSKLVLDEAIDSKLPKLEVFQSLKVLNDNDHILRQVEQLTLDINNYKLCKQNQEPNRLQNRLENLEDILVKTSKICYQVYSNKLRQDTRKFEESIQKMEEIRFNQDLVLKRIKEQNKQLKSREKLEIESQRELKKNKSDLDQHKRREEQFKSEPVELSRAKTQLTKKEEQIRNMYSQMKDLQRTMRTISQEKTAIQMEFNSEKSKLKDEMQKVALKLQETEVVLRTLREQKRTIQRQKQRLQDSVSILRNQVETQHHETQNSNIQQIHQIQIQGLQEKIIQMENNLVQQAHQIEQERMMNMELRVVLKNKEAQIISLQQKVEKVKSDEKSQSGDEHQQDNSIELVRLREENSRLQEQIESISYELDLIIRKQTYEVETQTDKDLVEIDQLKQDRLVMFVPYNRGVYVPLVICQSSRIDTQFSTTMVYRNNYFLNVNANFSQKTKEVVSESDFIIIAKVQNITQQVSYGDNQYGVRLGETYFVVEVNQPKYIIGFEEDDMSLRNYAQI